MFYRTLFVLLTSFCFTATKAQSGNNDTLFYNKGAYPSTKEEAHYYKLYFQESGGGVILQKTFYLSHSIRSITYYQNQELKKKIDSSLFYYLNGKLNWTTYYDKDGNPKSLKQLHPNGQTKREEYYQNGKLTKGKKYNEKGQRIRFTKLQVNPKYKGGYKSMIEFLNNNIQYPAQAKEMNIHGQVIVSFIVTKEGQVLNPRIEKSVHPLIDQEAMRVVQLMKHWRPGSMDDQKINSRLNIPITFGEDE